jgi:hypothetical protein
MSLPRKRAPKRTVSRRRLRQPVPGAVSSSESLARPVNSSLDSRQEEAEPSPALRSYVYLTLAVLGVVCVIGLLLLPAVLQFGSTDSYYGDRINSALYVVYFCILIGYTLAAGIHLGTSGYRARYTLLLVANIGLLVSVFAGAAVTYVSIFRM